MRLHLQCHDQGNQIADLSGDHRTAPEIGRLVADVGEEEDDC